MDKLAIKGFMVLISSLGHHETLKKNQEKSSDPTTPYNIISYDTLKSHWSSSCGPKEHSLNVTLIVIIFLKHEIYIVCKTKLKSSV